MSGPGLLLAGLAAELAGAGLTIRVLGEDLERRPDSKYAPAPLPGDLTPADIAALRAAAAKRDRKAKARKPPLPHSTEREMSEWKTIDTAPRDGTMILAHDALLGLVVAKWQATDPDDPALEWTPSWCVLDFTNGDTDWFGDLTHWQPLPPPPAENQQ